MGCSNGHGPSPKPGGDMAIFDIATGKIEAHGAGLGGNGGSTANPKLGQYYHATTSATIVVVDIKSRKPVQTVPTSTEARSLDVNFATGRVYLATTAKDGPCGGCIAGLRAGIGRLNHAKQKRRLAAAFRIHVTALSAP